MKKIRVLLNEESNILKDLPFFDYPSIELDKKIIHATEGNCADSLTEYDVIIFDYRTGFSLNQARIIQLERFLQNENKFLFLF